MIYVMTSTYTYFVEALSLIQVKKILQNYFKRLLEELYTA